MEVLVVKDILQEFVLDLNVMENVKGETAVGLDIL